MQAKKILAVLSATCLLGFASAQTCSVEVSALKGAYEGECKKGKAEGKGTAKGEDQYNGEFRSGVPDGSGKYSWANGDWYEGAWKKGKREGEGVMHYASKTGKDSIQKGFWKKDKYLGLYEKPFIVHSRSSKMVSDDIIKTQSESSNNEISFSAQSVTGPKPIFNNVVLLKGRYMTLNNYDHMAQSTLTTLRGVEFPIRIEIRYGNEVYEIEFFEPASWKVDLKIQR
jgi:hypothetical protein